MIKCFCRGFYQVYGDFPFNLVSAPLCDLIQEIVENLHFLKKQ